MRRAIAGYRPDVVHFHNTFPLLSPAALRAAHGAGVRVVQTLHNFRPLCPAATFLRDGRVCEDCLGRVPIPAVVHGCYRSSRLATLPIAAKDALHSAIGTWSKAVDTYITPSEFARSRYLKAGWPAEQIVVKYNTAPDPGTPRPDYEGGFVCLSRLAPEKGIDVLLDAWGRTFPDGGAAPQDRRVGRAGDRAAGSRGDARPVWSSPASSRATRASRSSPERARSSSRRAGTRCSRGSSPRPTRWACPSSPRGSAASRRSSPTAGRACTSPPTTRPISAGRCGRCADDRGLAERLGEGARREYEQHLSPGATTDRLLEIYSGAPPRVTAAGSAPLTAGGAAL